MVPILCPSLLCGDDPWGVSGTPPRKGEVSEGRRGHYLHALLPLCALTKVCDPSAPLGHLPFPGRSSKQSFSRKYVKKRTAVEINLHCGATIGALWMK